MNSGLGLILSFGLQMDGIPDDCIYEIMRQLGPALIQFRAISSRFWALFIKNRATLETKTITFHKMSNHVRSGERHRNYYYIKIHNNLISNKVLRIMDYYYGNSSLRFPSDANDTLTDIQKIKEIIRMAYMATFDCPDLENITDINKDIETNFACYGRADVYRKVKWIISEGWFYMLELESGRDNRNIRHVLNKFTIKYFIKGTILEEFIAKDMIGRSWPPKIKRKRRGPGKRI